MFSGLPQSKLLFPTDTLAVLKIHYLYTCTRISSISLTIKNNHFIIACAFEPSFICIEEKMGQIENAEISENSEFFFPFLKLKNLKSKTWK